MSDKRTKEINSIKFIYVYHLNEDKTLTMTKYPVARETVTTLILENGQRVRGDSILDFNLKYEDSKTLINQALNDLYSGWKDNQVVTIKPLPKRFNMQVMEKYVENLKDNLANFDRKLVEMADSHQRSMDWRKARIEDFKQSIKEYTDALETEEKEYQVEVEKFKKSYDNLPALIAKAETALKRMLKTK